MQRLKVDSYYRCMLHLPELLRLSTNRFQLYQVSLLLDRFHSAYSAEEALSLGHVCAGPGMIPLCMVLSKDSHAGEAVAQFGEPEASEAESDDGAADQLPPPAKKQKQGAHDGPYDIQLDALKVKGACSASQHAQAVKICKMMTQVLQTSAWLEECSKLCDVDLAQIINYDVMEYAICEHHRLVSKPKARRKGRKLKDCNFVRTHRQEVLRIRKAMLKHLPSKHPLKKSRR